MALTLCLLYMIQASFCKDELVFLSVGDWGSPTAQPVADQMARFAENNAAKFIVSTGDNFYPNGVTSVDDPQWQTTFENVFHHTSLQVPWYVCLGNHDLKNGSAEVLYTMRSQRWRLPAPYFATPVWSLGPANHARGINSGRTLQLFFLHTYSKRFEAQLTWLDKALAASVADWRIVVGHRPLVTSGGNWFFVRPNQKQTTDLFAIFERRGVQAYICGDNHWLEVLSYKNFSLFISGGGSGELTKLNRFVPRPQHPASLFAEPFTGFMVHRLTNDHFSTEVLTATGHHVFKFTTEFTRIQTLLPLSFSPWPVKA